MATIKCSAEAPSSLKNLSASARFDLIPSPTPWNGQNDFNLDTSVTESESISSSSAVYAGYFDNALAIFKHHNHPFILIGALALRWTGSKSVPGNEIQVLLRESQREAIVADLILKDWQHAQELPNRDMRLESRDPGHPFRYLRLSSEESYHLAAECNKTEVPDLSTGTPVLLEEGYDRDPYSRFGPRVISKVNFDFLPSPQRRAKLNQRGIAIYVPTVEDHINALLRQWKKELRQWREELRKKQKNYAGPRQQLIDLIGDLYLDWEPTKEWFLETKVKTRNRRRMQKLLTRYRRKEVARFDKVLNTLVFGKMPWELSIPS